MRDLLAKIATFQKLTKVGAERTPGQMKTAVLIELARIEKDLNERVVKSFVAGDIDLAIFHAERLVKHSLPVAITMMQRSMPAVEEDPDAIVEPTPVV